MAANTTNRLERDARALWLAWSDVARGGVVQGVCAECEERERRERQERARR